MSSSKKITCKGTLRQVFSRIYWLEYRETWPGSSLSSRRACRRALYLKSYLDSLLLAIRNFYLGRQAGRHSRVFHRVYRLEVMVGIFDPALWTVAPYPISLVHRPILWRHFALPSMSLIFLRCSQRFTGMGGNTTHMQNAYICVRSS